MELKIKIIERRTDFSSFYNNEFFNIDNSMIFCNNTIFSPLNAVVVQVKVDAERRR